MTLVSNVIDTTEVLSSIHEDFFDCYQKYTKIIKDIGATDDEFKTCTELCLMLRKRSDRAHIISANEEIEDINTEYLKFGLLSHMLSELCTNRSSGQRTRLLRMSNIYGKRFLDSCDNWTILKTKQREIFERGFETEVYSKMDPFALRTEIVSRQKMINKIEFLIEHKLRTKQSYHKTGASADTLWQLFNDEEDEREFWLKQFQIGIRKTLKTLKQNAFEFPLSQRWEAEQKETRLNHARSQNGLNNHSENNNGTGNGNGNGIADEEKVNVNHRSKVFHWNENKNGNANKNGNGNANEIGNGPAQQAFNVWDVNSSGKVTQFDNLQDMKLFADAQRNRIDATVQMRTDRNLIIRDANPWTYTVEQAAQLGMLSEIPKDYDAKRLQKQTHAHRNRQHLGRYGQPLGYDVDNDDGSELNPGQIEYHQRGNVTSFGMNDMPKEAEEHTDDMSEEVYQEKRREQIEWDSWKDGHEKGAGNPYYRT